MGLVHNAFKYRRLKFGDRYKQPMQIDIGSLKVQGTYLVESVKILMVETSMDINEKVE